MAEGFLGKSILSSSQMNSIAAPAQRIDMGGSMTSTGSRLGVQGEAPLTGLKGLGSTGGLRESTMKSGYSRPISGGGMTGNAGVSSSSRLGGTGAGGSGMRGGMAGGVYGLGGGADFGKIY